MFVPAAFITGISGQFFRQFALTIAAATVISLHRLADPEPGALRAAVQAACTSTRPRGSLLARPIMRFFNGFNRGFDGCRTATAR